MRFDFDDLVAVMARLRAPGGCPWDQRQDHASLAPYLLEEAHEVLDAIASGDPGALRDELGDLLLQVVFHAEIARAAGEFDAADVTDAIIRKLIGRHPHVFTETRAGAPLETPEAVLAQWHEIKRRESPERGPFDGIPTALPALARAQKIVGRAARLGDGPAEPAAVQALEWLRRAVEEGQHPRELIGDFLLSVAALADSFGVDAESALRGACERFVARLAPRSDDRP